MLSLYKFSLGPVLLAQAKWLRKTALRLPEASGPRSGTVHVEGGGAPLRLLFVGDSSAAGVGVQEQSQALAQPAAEHLAGMLKRSVIWTLVARSGVNTMEALALAGGHELEPADVLVTALGVNDVTSQRTVRQFIGDYHALVEHIAARTGVRHVVTTGLPPLRILPAAPHPLRWYLGKYAAALDRALQRWTASRPDCQYLSLEWAAVPEEMAIDGYHPGAGMYRTWAAMVAERIAALRLGAGC
jgi:lysophospholipase L1-like esterase